MLTAPRSATLAAWMRSWRAGLVSYDDVLDEVRGDDAEHLVDTRPDPLSGEPVDLRAGLAAFSRLDPDEIWLVLPEPGRSARSARPRSVHRRGAARRRGRALRHGGPGAGDRHHDVRLGRRVAHRHLAARGGGQTGRSARGAARRGPADQGPGRRAERARGRPRPGARAAGGHRPAAPARRGPLAPGTGHRARLAARHGGVHRAAARVRRAMRAAARPGPPPSPGSWRSPAPTRRAPPSPRSRPAERDAALRPLATAARRAHTAAINAPLR